MLSIEHRKPKASWTREEIIEQLKQINEVWYQIEDDVAKKNFIQEVFSSITIDTDVIVAIGSPGRKVPISITGCEFNE
ncbi:hypothetical protein B2K_03465 [Paenibacillus mucilaginosus K02]|uniref:Uncharacterized protein n=1 Tax=Paenibacillus mucilaginosus K02 TaxID=997761 RepID=I0BBP6_9BACL|nr:hypothetical protein B2K_03465 [Paenibacillus mucilaginosus K02]